MSHVFKSLNLHKSRFEKCSCAKFCKVKKLSESRKFSDGQPVFKDEVVDSYHMLYIRHFYTTLPPVIFDTCVCRL